MKKIVIGGLVGLVVGLLSPQIATAQGSTAFLSNLAQPSSGSVAVGSNSWIAATFFTGGNSGGYLLNSVQLAMNDPSGGPGAFTVMIYDEGPLLAQFCLETVLLPFPGREIPPRREFIPIARQRGLPLPP
jgi:hypothetical protein